MNKKAKLISILLSMQLISQPVFAGTYTITTREQLFQAIYQDMQKYDSSLTAMYNPITASVKDVVWSSSNEAVATVASNGNVTAIGKGIATVKVVSKQNPNIARTCTVTVK